MQSRNYEKASPSANSFWKKSPISAVPGRLSKSPAAAAAGPVAAAGASSPVSPPSAAPPRLAALPSGPTPASSSAMPKNTSFVAYDASVSDAWELVEGDPLPSPLSTAAATHAANRVAASAKSSTLVNGDDAPKVTSRKDDPSEAPVADSAGTEKALGLTSPQSSPSVISSSTSGGGDSKSEKLKLFLASDSVDVETLRKLSWSGLVPEVRPKAWKILCGYLPAASARQSEVLARKREEYALYVTQYFATKDQDIHQDTFRQIHIDIPRMSPVIALFQQRCVQEIFERILYIWAIRHPASGYVQGINDLVTPFFLVFLQDVIDGDRRLSEVDVAATLSQQQIAEMEADSFWCLTKVLDGIQDNYTFAQPGIQLKVRQLEELVRRIDAQLHAHLTGHEVLFLQFAFRWMNNILMRELPIRATIRLWDTYLSEIEGFSHFHLYVCAAFLIHWKAELMKKSDFHTLLMFLQNLPTAKWGDRQIDLLVAEAWKLSYLFADAPSHLANVQQQNQGAAAQ